MLSLSDDARILKVLRGRHDHLSRLDLATEAQVALAAVDASVRSLRGAGYEIEERPHAGLKFIMAPDRLIADDIAAQLGEVSLPRELLVFQETDSTNDIAARLGREGAKEGAVIFAEKQTAGRGRLGRRWESGQALGLWFSLLARPAMPVALWPRLTTWAAVGVAEGIEAISPIEVSIKWPNDIFARGLKIAGILIETHVDAAGNAYAVVGIGVNVNHESEDFAEELRGKAGSVRMVTGNRMDRQQTAVAILRSLDRRYGNCVDDFSALVAVARKRSFLTGRAVEIRSGQTAQRGWVEDLDEEGALLLRGAEGKLTRVSSGEASLCGWE